MIIKQGDLFTTDAKFIAHGVNCVGVMGAGVAWSVRDRFPETYLAYNQRCKQGKLGPGGLFAHFENDKFIVNLATQDQPGAHARYEWVFECFYKLSRKLSTLSNNEKITVAIPQIGCGIGGLEWEPVRKIIEAVEAIYPDVEYEVWIYEG